MERRRRAALLVAAALLIAAYGERHPLLTLNLPESDSGIAATPAMEATVKLGALGLSILVRLRDTR